MDGQKLFNLLLKLFLFLSPIFFFKDYQLSFARGLFFILGTFMLFAVSLGCEPKRRFSNVWLSVFLLLAFMRMFFDNEINPRAEWFNFWFSCAGFIYVFCGVLLFYVVYCYADDIRQYFAPIVWVCIINFVLTLAQAFHCDFMWTYTPSICGFMENSSQLGQYSALAMPVLFFINPFLITLPLFTLIASKSISPIVAGAITGALLGGFKGRILMIKAGIGVILVFLAFFNYGYIKTKFQCRPIMWKKTLKIALQRPYLGWGYRSFNEKVLNIKGGSLGSVEFSRPHNDYLHTAQELGFPVLIPIGMFFMELFKKFKAVKKDKLLYCLAGSVIIALINMGGQTFIRYASVAGTFVILSALLCAEVDYRLG